MRKIIILPLFLILLLNCSKKSPSEAEEVSGGLLEKESAPMTLSANDSDDSESETRSKKVSSSVKNDEELDPAGYNNFYPVEGRMLEYSVEMHFESENLVSSRQLLYDSIAKHGFLQNSRTSLYSTAPSLEISARIKSENFYQMLKELRNAGSLKSEEINVYDLTSDNIMTLITKNRREERIKRRSSTLLNPSLSPKDHSARERALEESEDQMDMAEHQLWQLQDRVTWASLTIYVTGPDTGKTIVVPRFKDAFKSLLNGTLEVLYNMILVSPFLIILVIIFIKRKKLWDIFMTQHKSGKNRED